MKEFKIRPGLLYLIIGLLLIAGLGGFRFLASLMQNGFSLFLVGLVLYWLISGIAGSGQVRFFYASSANQEHFTASLVRILVHVIQADRHVDAREIQAILAFFQIYMHFDGHRINRISELIQTELKTPQPLSTLCQDFRQQFNYQSRILLLQLVYQVALSDHPINTQEQHIIDAIAKDLHISPTDHQQIRAFFQSRGSTPPAEDAYRVLGVSRNATAADIKKAYREATKKYHPDKVHHLGPEYQKVAQEKMQQINRAYEALTR
ncbi:MAG: TerB family tellurite resistance protein [Candidatus Margulisiibacteriota bacterium]